MSSFHKWSSGGSREVKPCLHGVGRGLDGWPGSSSPCPTPRPCQSQVQSHQLPRSPGSTGLGESLCPRQLFPRVQAVPRRRPAPARETARQDRSPASSGALCPCSHSRSVPLAGIAVSSSPVGPGRKARAGREYQLLSWPRLRIRTGQPWGATCTRHDHCLPSHAPCLPRASTLMGCALGANMLSGSPSDHVISPVSLTQNARTILFTLMNSSLHLKMSEPAPLSLEPLSVRIFSFLAKKMETQS